MLKRIRIFYTILYLNISSVLSQLDENPFHGKIVGGSSVSVELFPSTVQIFNSGSMCAGTILNSWAILTAAHCFDLNKDTSEIVVQIGSRYVYDFSANQYNVVELVTHNKYNQTGFFACDIALIFVETRIQFTKATQKAVLVNSKEWMNSGERNFTVSGWGQTKYEGEISELGLMMTYLRFIPKSQCSKLHNQELSEDMFCLYGDGERDTCKGDSGGGVYWKGMLVGITSHGDGCAKKNKPSVYTNVWYFRDWIEKEILDYFDKNCIYLN